MFKHFLRKRLYILGGLILPCLMLSGCGTDAVISAVKSTFNLDTAKVWLEKVNIKTASDANNNSPLQLHILIVYKKELLADLGKLNADTYFGKYEQIKNDNVGQVDFFVQELVPGQNVDGFTINPSKVSGEGVLVFARYSHELPGDHRMAIGEDKEVTIYLDKIDFRIESVKK